MMLVRILYFNWLLRSLVRHGYSPCSEVTEEVPWLDSSARQSGCPDSRAGWTHRLCSRVRRGHWLDSLPGQGCRLCSTNKKAMCWVLLLGGLVEGAPWLGGTAGWAVRLLMVPGYTRPETMLNSRARLLAWLPDQVALRVCSTTPGHLWPTLPRGQNWRLSSAFEWKFNFTP